MTFRPASVVCAVLAVAAAAAQEQHPWPQFRGPGGQSDAGAEAPLPLTWSESKNIRWKSAVPGRGWSSPVVGADGRVWLTTAVPLEDEPNGQTLRLLSYDSASGKALADIEVFRIADAGKQHAKNSFASPTPVLDGDMVFVHFGRLGTAGVRMNGEVVWKTELAYQYVHGSGNSPVLHNGLLLVNCDGADTQFVVALDRNTGEVRWKRQRPRANMAFATPLMIEVEGKAQLVSPGAKRTIAYEPATGEPIWWVEYGDGFSNVPRPVFANGFVYLCTGFYQPELLAVRPDGKGDVTETHVAWRAGRGVPLTPSPIVAGGEIYYISDNGVLSCLDALTGRQLWQQRLGGNFSASPLLAGGRIYWTSEEGEVTVIEPGREFRKLATNTLDGQTFASPAVLGRALLVRSATHLYRIEESAGAPD